MINEGDNFPDENKSIRENTGATPEKKRRGRPRVHPEGTMKYGTSVGYRLEKLKRDYPEFCEQWMAEWDQYKSLPKEERKGFEFVYSARTAAGAERLAGAIPPKMSKCDRAVAAAKRLPPFEMFLLLEALISEMGEGELNEIEELVEYRRSQLGATLYPQA